MAMSDTKRVVYLMRGLPGCGKSYTARRLAGAEGVVLETDEYFYTQVGNDPTTYDYSEATLHAARQWNWDRFCAAIAEARTPIVVDRGNGLNVETRVYAVYAMRHGYEVQLAEPDSPWWQELKVLLKYKNSVASELFDAWAAKLSESTRHTHRVPAATIRHWMSRWRYDLTVEEIIALQDSPDD